MMNKIRILTAVCILSAMPALAEISELSTVPDAAPVSESPDLKAFISFGGGNALILKDGTVTLSMRGGVKFNPSFKAGIWASTVIDDVRNYDAANSEFIDYKAMGLLAEYKAFSYKDFSISAPVELGCGYVDVKDEGVEDSQAKDGFFIADAAVHFNYQVTKSLEASLGGGYRMFLGIDYNNLDNGDFDTPFAELLFTWSEF